MRSNVLKSREYFIRALELAYFIHANKDIAFFIAEDALDDLPLMLANQAKNRRPLGRLRGVWKSGEQIRPIRRTIELDEQRMLQWLVYRHSERWERQTESGGGPYAPTEEDLIVRYIKHLVLTTLRRGSFYVALAVGPFLHQLDRRETRLLYDILAQGDSARLKDSSYIGKQRLELLEAICQRFGDLIETEKSPRGDKQVVARPATDEVTKTARACLERFVPWDSNCVVGPRFNVTDVQGLFFQETLPVGEDCIELNRIHTLLDPECFTRFLDGLADFVGVLPKDHQDKSCDYRSASDRLVVPKFSTSSGQAGRGDRFKRPALTMEDYIRVDRFLEARAGRRTGFRLLEVRVYVDNTPLKAFDPREASLVKTIIEPAAVIDVRGRTESGELTLTSLMAPSDGIMTGALKDSLSFEGHGITVQLTPIMNSNTAGGQVEVTVSYSRPGVWWNVRDLAAEVYSELRRIPARGDTEPRYALRRLATGVAFALLLTGLLLIWLPRQSPDRRQASPDRRASNAEGSSEEEAKAEASPTQPTAIHPKGNVVAKSLATAGWSRDPADALRAISIAATREEATVIVFSDADPVSFFRVAIYDDAGQIYVRYRLTMTAGKRLWQQALAPPRLGRSEQARILKFSILPQRLPGSGPFDLRVEAISAGRWSPLGHVLLRRADR